MCDDNNNASACCLVFNVMFHGPWRSERPAAPARPTRSSCSSKTCATRRNASTSSGPRAARHPAGRAARASGRSESSSPRQRSLIPTWSRPHTPHCKTDDNNPTCSLRTGNTRLEEAGRVAGGCLATDCCLFEIMEKQTNKKNICSLGDFIQAQGLVGSNDHLAD